MQRDHRPYWLKKYSLIIHKLYVKWLIEPHMSYLGKKPMIINPWYMELFGRPIEIGDYVNIFSAPDARTRLLIWSEAEGLGRISIGDCCLLSPGVRIISANHISIGHSCMFARNVSIADSDWHDVYDRVAMGMHAPVVIEENVWVGESAIICKGVTIGENSVVGAGSVVVRNIPSNCIAAGNPAQKVKSLDPERTIKKRSDWFQDPGQLFRDVDQVDRDNLEKNAFIHWLRVSLLPGKND
ncbi:MAG: hexapeptide repeat-containing transferase [Candidatus Magnetoglobus multicellularis str. Araruama]|uniref:Hexapeptide repeat-containing transferase n=1 Tax=Candidatus Magnetoglobus multicellularis str. Araruama TaxID=890399 RepID=A0A1V1P716_9BACT|nr:MAG: hexapeptide repeat-containing transferase [Candidatus Magnetoglobus multicellularis str. Araruama]